jgi:hypothetical protein
VIETKQRGMGKNPNDRATMTVRITVTNTATGRVIIPEEEIVTEFQDDIYAGFFYHWLKSKHRKSM